MSRLLVGCFVVVMLVAATGVGARAAEREAADLAARMDAVVKASYPADGPGAAAIVVKDGRVIYRAAYGMASLELGVALAPDMVFRLGSITKQFTAAAVLALAHDGKLALADPIEKYLPGYPTHGHVITIEHLLTHSSGIQSYTDIPGWFASRIKADMTLDELIDAFKKEPMQFAPGTRFRYNNSGYVLLGAIIEKASGQSYEQFLKARLFEPLGMTSTHFGSNEPIIRRRVQGYTRTQGVVRHAPYLSMTQPHAAGSLVSSVDDLARWDAALYTDAVVPQALLTKAWTPYALSTGKPTGYGYGWGVGSMRKRQFVAHGGGIPGFSTYAVRLPEDRVYVAVLANSDAPAASPELVGRTLAAMAAGDPFPPRVAASVPADVLQRYAGVYQIDEEARRTVTVENGRLYTQRSGGARQEAKPRSETEFFYDESLTSVHFVVGAGGRATEMLVYQNGGDDPERAVRVSDAPAGPEVVGIDPAVYDAYVGAYELAPGFTLTVTREGDRLMTQATGQQKIEIFPLSETEFFPKVVDARITFVREADGSVRALVLKQGGREMRGARKP
jgi:D-alanyl-D-alanine carboxypeptidase